MLLGSTETCCGHPLNTLRGLVKIHGGDSRQHAEKTLEPLCKGPLNTWGTHKNMLRVVCKYTAGTFNNVAVPLRHAAGTLQTRYGYPPNTLRGNPKPILVTKIREINCKVHSNEQKINTNSTPPLRLPFRQTVSGSPD